MKLHRRPPFMRLAPCPLDCLRPVTPGYYPKAVLLANNVKQLLPAAVIEMAAGRSSSFEVTVNGRLIYSKLACGAFPAFSALAAQIAEFAATGKAPAGWL